MSIQTCGYGGNGRRDWLRTNCPCDVWVRLPLPVLRYGKILVMYGPSEVDMFFFYRHDGRCWLVPFDKVNGKMAVRPESMLPNFEVVLEQ